jgi:hypothetical protein
MTSAMGLTPSARAASVVPWDLIGIQEVAAEYGVHRTTTYNVITKYRLRRYRRSRDRRAHVKRSDLRRVFGAEPVKTAAALQSNPTKPNSQIMRQSP